MVADAPSELRLDVTQPTLELGAGGPRPAEERLSPGAVLSGRYEVRSVLGAGGMGVVYEVADRLHPEREVALKRMTRLASRDEVTLLANEFATLAQLSHPNIARVFDFELCPGGEPFFTMERVRGEPLHTHLWRTPDLDLPATLTALVAVCRALSYLHNRHITHFDLKPANVLVREDGEVKVLDFGLAAQLVGDGQERKVRGTASYMAPERLQYGSRVDHRSDLYSLGIVLFQLVGREGPYAGSSGRDLLRAHLERPLSFGPRWDAVPPWVRALVERLCAKDPADRPRSADEVIDAINAGGGFRFAVETEATRASYVFSSRFMGRREEFERLRGFARHRLAGEDCGPSALLVQGASGAGKSRLLREVRHALQLEPATLLQGQCFAAATSEYGPFVEILEHARLTAATLEARNLLESHRWVLAKLLPSEGPAPASAEDPLADPFRIAEALTDLLLDLARLQPFALCIEDLHRALPGTALVFDNLVQKLAQRARRGRPVPLPVFASLRPVEAFHTPAAEAVQRLLAHGSLDLVPLAPLDSRATWQLVSSMLGSLPPTLMHAVQAQCGGNPGAQEELVWTFMESGALTFTSGTWEEEPARLAPLLPLVPAQLLERRLARLDPVEEDVLALLSAFGQPLPAAVLFAASAVDGPRLHQALAALEQRQIVHLAPGPPLAYELHGERLGAAVLARLPADAVRSRHLRLARALQQVHADALEPHLSALATHLAAAGERAEARAFSLRAARRATARAEYELAHRHLCAARVLGSDRSPDTEEVREHLADLEVLLGRYAAAEQEYVALLHGSTSALSRSRLLRKLGMSLNHRGEFEASARHLRQALALLGFASPRSTPGVAVGTLAALAAHLGHAALGPPPLERDPARRERLEEAGLAYYWPTDGSFHLDAREAAYLTLRTQRVCEPLGDSFALGKALCNTGMTCALLTLNKAATRACRRGLEVGRRLGSGEVLLEGYGFLGMVEGFQGRLGAARGHLEQARSYRRYGSVYARSLLDSVTAYVLRLVGDLPAMAEQVEAGLDEAQRCGAHNMGRVLELAQAWLRVVRDDQPGAGLAEFERLIAQAREGGDDATLLSAQILGADALWRCGGRERGLALAEEAIAASDWRTRLFDPLQEQFGLGALLLADSLGAPPSRARWHRRRLESRARLAWRVARRHPSGRPLGALAMALGRWHHGRRREALGWFERALLLAQSQGSALRAADALLCWGRCLLEGSPAERALGGAHLHRAAEGYERCGSPLGVRRAREGLER